MESSLGHTRSRQGCSGTRGAPAVPAFGKRSLGVADGSPGLHPPFLRTVVPGSPASKGAAPHLQVPPPPTAPGQPPSQTSRGLVPRTALHGGALWWGGPVVWRAQPSFSKSWVRTHPIPPLGVPLTQGHRIFMAVTPSGFTILQPRSAANSPSFVVCVPAHPWQPPTSPSSGSHGLVWPAGLQPPRVSSDSSAHPLTPLSRNRPGGSRPRPPPSRTLHPGSPSAPSAQRPLPAQQQQTTLESARGPGPGAERLHRSRTV